MELYLKTSSGTRPRLFEESFLHRTERLLNKHRGERRCFVLATGPSIKEEDLTPLRNEWCIGVGEFYRHQHYRLIRPAYYAFAPTHPPFTDDDKLRELAEMKQQSQNETFFFAASDKQVVEKSDLVADCQRVHYLDFRIFRNDAPAQVDLTSALPTPCSAAVIAVWIAIYMGFAEIYLVGCDHNILWKWDPSTSFSVEKSYQHFYNDAPAVWSHIWAVDDLLKNALLLRQTYRWTNQIALPRGTKILMPIPVATSMWSPGFRSPSYSNRTTHHGLKRRSPRGGRLISVRYNSHENGAARVTKAFIFMTERRIFARRAPAPLRSLTTSCVTLWAPRPFSFSGRPLKRRRSLPDSRVALPLPFIPTKDLYSDLNSRHARTEGHDPI